MLSEKKIINLRAGQVLFREHDHSKELFIVQKGQIRIFRLEGYKQVELETVQEGGVVGELAIIDGRSRSASAEATQDSDLIIITQEDFNKAINTIPAWFKDIVKIIVERLRHADRRIEGQIIKHNISNIANMLVFLLTKYKEESNAGLDLKFAKREIIEMLGVTESDLTKILDDFVEKKLINISHNTIEIPEVEKIEDYAIYVRSREIHQTPPNLGESSLAIVNLLISLADPHHRQSEKKMTIDIDQLLPDLTKILSKEALTGEAFLDELINHKFIKLQDKSPAPPSHEQSQEITEDYKNKALSYDRHKLEEVLIFLKFENAFKHPHE